MSKRTNTIKERWLAINMIEHNLSHFSYRRMLSLD
jgi:hypothetical protein